MSASPYSWRREKREIEREHAELVERYNARKVHPQYSRPCEVCGKPFVARDWAIEKNVCSEACDLAHSKNLPPNERYRIKLFWRDFGNEFPLLEDLTCK